jgi:RNA polymerase sigma factor (sigma-70 family)
VQQPQQPRGLDPQISELIRHKVKRLVGNYGFRRDDVEDLQQELTMHVVKALKRYDATRASVHTYADRIVSSKIASIVAKATAQKRDPSKLRRLDDQDDDVLGSRSLTQDQLDLAADVRVAVSCLPVDLLRFARLFETYSESEIVRRTGVTRQRVRTIRRRIGEHLRGHGLGPSCPPQATRRRAAPVDDLRGSLAAAA